MIFLPLLTVAAQVKSTVSHQPERASKLISVFNIVKFPNDACNTTLGLAGVCYTATECASLGGSSSGSCASGFGVCCTFRNNQILLQAGADL